MKVIRGLCGKHRGSIILRTSQLPPVAAVSCPGWRTTCQAVACSPRGAKVRVVVIMVMVIVIEIVTVIGIVIVIVIVIVRVMVVVIT